MGFKELFQHIRQQILNGESVSATAKEFFNHYAHFYCQEEKKKETSPELLAVMKGWRPGNACKLVTDINWRLLHQKFVCGLEAELLNIHFCHCKKCFQTRLTQMSEVKNKVIDEFCK